MSDLGPRGRRPCGTARGASGRAGPSAHPRRGTTGLNPGSSIALLFASLVVCAHEIASPCAPTGRGDGRRARAGAHGGAAPCTPTLWRRAIAGTRTDELARLLDTCPDAGLVELATEQGVTALMAAARADDAVLARALLAAGADVGRTTSAGGSALMFCALGARLDVARLLRRAGAGLDARSIDGWTASSVAAARGAVPMLRWLLAEGADPGPADVHGVTPLMRAVDGACVEAVRALLAAAPGEVDAADARGVTALHRASAQGCAETVSLLLAAGADPAASSVPHAAR